MKLKSNGFLLSSTFNLSTEIFMSTSCFSMSLKLTNIHIHLYIHSHIHSLTIRSGPITIELPTGLASGHQLLLPELGISDSGDG